MIGRTPRQRATAGAVLLVGVAIAVLAVMGQFRVAAAGLALLLTLGIVVGLTLRTRLAAIDQRLRTAARKSRSASAGESAEALRARLASTEEKLAAARHEIDRIDDLTTASYRQSIRQHVRTFRTEDRLGAATKSPALQLPYKLRGIEFAASHGVAVPEIYQVWPDAASIELDLLPDSFVVKADGGAGSVAVFPLQRVESGRYQLIGGTEEFGTEQLRERIESLGRAARAPFFAEELLHGVGGGPIPHDVKCYMFHGEVGHILIRAVAEHGRASTIRLKFIDEHGTDYGPVGVGRKHNPDLKVPETLPEIIEIARHLSRAVGLPFCRVDLYETSRGIVLGEITRAPMGGNEHYVEAHDTLLGQRWVDGSARLQSELSAGRPFGPIFGTVADAHLYPPDDRPRSAANFGRTVADCSQWCYSP